MAYKKNPVRDEKRLIQITGYIGKKQMEKLMYYSKSLQLPLTRLIGMAVDNELYEKEDPFNWDFTIPEDDYVEYAFADEAGKILNFLKSLPNGLSKDQLLILRHDMDIPDKTAFMLAFRECLEKNMIEAYVAPKSVKYNNSFGDVILYRLISTSPSANKKVRKKVREELSDLAQYEKLKKKLGYN